MQPTEITELGASFNKLKADPVGCIDLHNGMRYEVGLMHAVVLPRWIMKSLLYSFVFDKSQNVS